MANLFRCGGKPLITKTRDVSFSHTATDSSGWYPENAGVSFDFVEKIIGIKKVEIISSYGSYHQLQGAYITNETTQAVLVGWSRADNQTQGCTVRVTAVGY